MARSYAVPISTAALTAAKDLFRISAAATTILRVIRVEITQEASETSEQLTFSLYRASTDGTGTSVTATPLEVGHPAFAGTAIRDLSADTTKSPTTALWKSSQNVLSGFLFSPVPEERIIIPPSGRLVGRIDTATFGSVTFSGTVIVEEEG